METSKTLTYVVTENDVAARVGSGTAKVLATPVLAAWFEHAALELAQGYLGAGESTVGSAISMTHEAPSPVGMHVRVTATLTHHEGRRFDFALEAADDGGMISRGEHTRFAIREARFQEKADAKLKR